MAGDLTKWKSPDIPPSEGDSLKFRRNGGWFITKKLLYTLLILIVILIIVAIIVTKQLTEYKYKPQNETSSENAKHSPLIRLSKEIIPQHYELKLKPYLDSTPSGIKPFTLIGEALIRFQVTKPTSTITFHYAGLNINCTNIYNNRNNNSLATNSGRYHKNLELYTIELDENVHPGDIYSVKLNFINKIGDEKKGFYRSRHVSENSYQGRWLGISQLEPVYARRLFPCFDEPKFRATFDISVNRLKNMTSLANTNRKSSDPDKDNNDWIWDTYETTPIMPAHKISIIIGDLTVSKLNIGSSTLSIWTGKNLFKDSLNIIDITSSLIEFYQSYFTKAQPIRKLDLVAIPDCSNKHTSGWGLITFSESLIFTNKNQKEEMEFALEIGKKLAEQWIGNFVSFNWWTDVWIKEGLTTYLTYQAVNKIKPNYDIISSFVVNVLQKALDLEGYPLPGTIYTSNDIIDIWSTHNSELKGASLFHMISTNLPNSKNFQDSINSFIENWSEKTTCSEHLWESISRNNDNKFDIIKFVKSWLKTGFPVLNTHYDNSSGEVIINQDPFYLQHPPSDSSKWYIAITYTSSEKMKSNEMPKKIWMTNENYSKRFVIPTNDTWILINLPQQGVPDFYRVNYAISNWESLIKELNDSDSLDDIVKSSLLDDSYQLAKAGRLPYEIPFNLSLTVRNLNSSLPLLTIDKHLNFIEQFFYTKTENIYPFKNFVKILFTPLINNSISTLMNFNNSLPINHFQAILLKWSCRYNISNCIDLARSKFDKWINNKNVTEKLLLTDVELRTGVKFGNVDQLEIILNRTSSNDLSPKERLQLLKALTASSNSSFVFDLLQGILGLNQKMKNWNFYDEEIAEIWESLNENLEIKLDLLKFFLDNWNVIYEKYSNNNRVLNAIIFGCTENLTEEDQLTEVASLNEYVVKEDKVPLRSLELAINKLIVKTAWKNTKFNTVKQLLNQLPTL